MIRPYEDDPHALVAEHLVRLYLRLNGYMLLGGYLLHRPRGAEEGLRTEIDALAVRFPYQREPLHEPQGRAEQENDPALVSPKKSGLVDFIVAEVKTGKKLPCFNPPLVNEDRGAKQNLEDVLNMLGCFENEQEIATAGDSLLKQLQKPSWGHPPTYKLTSGNAQIRFLLFWDPPDQEGAERFFIPLSHILEFVARRTEQGVSCACYPRWEAKWRGAPYYILKAIDALRPQGNVCENLKEVEDHILRSLGKGALQFL